jgi:hypothetical protein
MKLVASIARGRRWLDELIADPTANTESIAGREGCSVRKVNMTISLAFLAPDLVKAAIDGRLPHGMGVARLCDLPAEWSRQRQMLGLAALLPSNRVVSGKQDCKARDNSAKTASSLSLVSAETGTGTAELANSGPFGSSQEISASAGSARE